MPVQPIQASRRAPTVAARELGIVATAMYDAWSAFDTLAVPTQPNNGVFRQTGGAVTAAAKTEAISYAAFRAEMDLFPANPQMAALGYDPTNTSTDSTTPAGVGNLAAAAILAFRHNDGSNQLVILNGGAPYSDYSGYTTPNPSPIISDPNSWQPLSVPNGQGGLTIQKYAIPFWGAVILFAPLPAFYGWGPSRYPSRNHTADADSILAYSAGLNDTSKRIAEYRADSPGTQLPPGHWSRIGEYVSRRDQHSLDADVQMFFALTNTLLDAGISC